MRNWTRTLLGLPPVWIALAVLLGHGLLLFGRKDLEIVYGDSGLMYLQTRQLLAARFTNFAFDYPGRDLDPQNEFIPYRKPFLVNVGGEAYIDFPPYFPLLAAPFLAAFGYAGLYLPGFFGLAATLLLLLACARFAGLGRAGQSMVLLLYGLAGTAPLYNYIFHEYPVALACWTGALFFLLRLEHQQFRAPAAFAFGALGGLAVVFRMELAVPVAAAGMAYLLIVRERPVAFAVWSLGGFLLPVSALLIGNQEIHGHPLGLRYAMTIAENTNPDSRWQIVYGLLFSDVRGLFFQSPFFSTLCLAPFARVQRAGRLLLVLTGVAFLTVLASAPNHGDHIAPRYLFGLFAPGCILTVLIVRDWKWTRLRRALSLFVLILAILSFRSHYKSYTWIRNSDTAARAVLEKIRMVEARHIVFEEYGSPLNLQNLFQEKVFLVAEDAAKKNELARRLREAGAGRWAMVGAIQGPAPDPQAFYENLKTRGWPLADLRPERIFLEPPLFVVEVSDGKSAARRGP